MLVYMVRMWCWLREFGILFDTGGVGVGTCIQGEGLWEML